jgi:polysaccharide biosynthesis transport protein
MHIIPSQPDTPGPQDLLGSRRMRDLVRQMSSLYDLVVIDSPPIMAVSDAIVLSGLADATLMMVRWETRHGRSRSLPSASCASPAAASPALF